jgi:calcineurin-like phosphoesterase family protein
MENIWFTADTHFGHANIIKYCNRPFKSAEEHDEVLIKNWNSIVSPHDRIYHLGDFGFERKGYLERILDQLNGVKYFIRGNHDGSMRGGLLNYFTTTGHYKEIKIKDEEMDLKQNLILFHYPIESWNKKMHGSWHLHGHTHGTLPVREEIARLDVGVDTNALRPISYEEIKLIMTKRLWKP